MKIMWEWCGCKIFVKPSNKEKDLHFPQRQHHQIVGGHHYIIELIFTKLYNFFKIA
jgi:hypothetical protein